MQTCLFFFLQVSPGPVPTVQYNQLPPQFCQNREVFAQQSPMSIGFFQPPPAPPPQQQLINQQCYQTPMATSNFCNNPVYNHPPPYNTPSQCFSYNNQPVVFNTPPPSQGDYCQTLPFNSAPPPLLQQQQQPPPVNYCSSFENDPGTVMQNFERAIHHRSVPDFTENRRVVKPVFPGKPQMKRFPNKNFDSSGANKKKRIVDNSNLHEIKPVETAPILKVVEKPKEATVIKIVMNNLNLK